MSSPSQESLPVASVFRAVLPGLALFEIFYKLLASFAVRPALGLLADKTLGRQGVNLAFNERILSALLTPAGLLGGALLAVLAVLAAYYEFCVLFLMAWRAAEGRPLALRTAMELAVPQMRALKSWGVLGFAVYALGLLPLMNLGLAPSLLPSLRIPNFVTGELSKTPLGQAAVVLFYALAFALFAVLLFTLPAMCLGRLPFGLAVRRGAGLLRRAGPRAWAGIAGFLAVWCALFRWPGFLPTRFVGITGAGFKDLGVGLLSGKLLPGLPAFALSGLLRIGLTVLLAALLAAYYQRAGGTACLDTAALPAITARVDRTGRILANLWSRAWGFVRGLWASFWRRPFCQKHKKLLAALLALAVLFFIGDVFASPPVLHAPIAIGHRGSRAGVENTLESVQGAIDGGADYAEIDILLSGDGVPMVIHDANLARLTGENVNVWELTAQQLGALTLTQNGREGRISTFAEMLDFCRGKIDLVVELKTHGHETLSVAREVARVVEEKDAAQNCIFMSIDYGQVQALHALHPQYTIGYCVYGSVTDVDAGALVDSGVDFLTIEENMVAPRFINRCLWAGLPLYVWTVNDMDNMELYLKEGVLGIVSDYPEVAAGAVEGRWGDSAQEYFRWQNQWAGGYTYPDDEEELPPEDGSSEYEEPDGDAYPCEDPDSAPQKDASAAA